MSEKDSQQLAERLAKLMFGCCSLEGMHFDDAFKQETIQWFKEKLMNQQYVVLEEEYDYCNNVFGPFDSHELATEFVGKKAEEHGQYWYYSVHPLTSPQA